MNLQRAVFPKFEMCTEGELYFRINQFASIDIANSVVRLEKLGMVQIHILMGLALESGKDILILKI